MLLKAYYKKKVSAIIGKLLELLELLYKTLLGNSSLTKIRIIHLGFHHHVSQIYVIRDDSPIFHLNLQKVTILGTNLRRSSHRGLTAVSHRWRPTNPNKPILYCGRYKYIVKIQFN